MLAVMGKPGGRRYTAEALAELERHEIVGGELVQKAQPSFRHGMTQGLICGALTRFQESHRGAERPGGAPCPGGWWIGSEIEVELAPHEVYLPDVAGWRVERMPEPFEARPVRIAPDWVCKVLSPSTADRDTGRAAAEDTNESRARPRRRRWSRDTWKRRLRRRRPAS